jgi:hypothetical protein
MLPRWPVITTVLTGDEIWYAVVVRCVPGTEKPGLALAGPGPADDVAGLALPVAWHPARTSPASPVISASDPARLRAAPEHSFLFTPD